MELAPLYYIAYENIGRLYLDMKRYPEAETVLRKTLTLKPPNPSFPLVNLAIALAEQGKREEAVTFLQEAVRVEPDDAQAWGNMGSLMHLIGRNNEAYTALLNAAKRDQYNPTYHKNLAIVCYALNKLEESRMFLRNAIQLVPKDAEVQSMMKKVEERLRSSSSSSGGGGGSGGGGRRP